MTLHFYRMCHMTLIHISDHQVPAALRGRPVNLNPLSWIMGGGNGGGAPRSNNHHGLSVKSYKSPALTFEAGQVRMDEGLVAKLELMTKQFVVVKPIEVR